MISVSAANFKMAQKFSVSPPPLNTLLENAPVLESTLRSSFE